MLCDLVFLGVFHHVDVCVDLARIVRVGVGLRGLARGNGATLREGLGVFILFVCGRARPRDVDIDGFGNFDVGVNDVLVYLLGEGVSRAATSDALHARIQDQPAQRLARARVVADDGADLLLGYEALLFGEDRDDLVLDALHPDVDGRVHHAQVEGLLGGAHKLVEVRVIGAALADALHDLERHQAAQDLARVSVVANLLEDVALRDGPVPDGLEHVVLAVLLGALGRGRRELGLITGALLADDFDKLEASSPDGVGYARAHASRCGWRVALAMCLSQTTGYRWRSRLGQEKLAAGAVWVLLRWSYSCARRHPDNRCASFLGALAPSFLGPVSVARRSCTLTKYFAKKLNFAKCEEP